MPTTLNPATEAEIASYDALSDDGLDAALDRAADAFEAHRQTSFADRADRMRTLADRLDAQKDDLGRLMTEEMGKPLDQAVAEAEKCAWVCRYYAEYAEEQLRSLATHPVVRHAWGRGQTLRLHAWVYQLSNGKVNQVGSVFGGEVVKAS